MINPKKFVMSNDESAKSEYDTVATLFYKLTSVPTVANETVKLDSDVLSRLCNKIDCEPGGRSVALQMFIHKIQSPFEAEVLVALDALKVCVESCDIGFRNEIGKFKFLNELIKVLSPKYLGNRTTDRVRRRISDLLLSWRVLMPNNSKITETYRLLKSQSLVSDLETTAKGHTPFNNSTSSINRMPSVFTDKKHTKRLAELLKSSNPTDILEANRLIKKLAVEEERRMEKLSNRSVKVQGIRSTARIISDIIAAGVETSPSSVNMAYELYGQLKLNSMQLQKMATESDDIDNQLGDVLEVNDLVLKTIRDFDEFSKQLPPILNELDSERHPESRTGDTSIQTDADNQTDLSKELIDLDIREPIDESINSETTDLALSSKANAKDQCEETNDFLDCLIRDLHPIMPVNFNAVTNVGLEDLPLSSIDCSSLDASSSKIQSSNTEFKGLNTDLNSSYFTIDCSSEDTKTKPDSIATNGSALKTNFNSEIPLNVDHSSYVGFLNTRDSAHNYRISEVKSRQQHQHSKTSEIFTGCDVFSQQAAESSTALSHHNGSAEFVPCENVLPDINRDLFQCSHPSNSIRLEDFVKSDRKSKFISDGRISLNIYEGLRPKTMSSDCFLFLAVLENKSIETINNLDMSILVDDNWKLVCEETSGSAGTLRPNRPPLPISSAIKLFVMRLPQASCVRKSENYSLQTDFEPTTIGSSQ